MIRIEEYFFNNELPILSQLPNKKIINFEQNMFQAQISRMVTSKIRISKIEINEKNIPSSTKNWKK
jgi:hypothetical protein